jgi:predicted ATPase
LTIVTGDNSLGKTFLLEAIWHALTGDWANCKLLPRNGSSHASPSIRFELATKTSRTKRFTARYARTAQRWTSDVTDEALPGLVIFGRFDGSFAVWDPAKAIAERQQGQVPTPLVFTMSNIWDGLETDQRGKKRVLCNGLIRDVVTWQTAPNRYHAEYSALVAAIAELSPVEHGAIEFGEPVRLPFDTREIPTLRLPYGTVPILHASAGVQRIVALAYFMVWAWHEHKQYSQVAAREPQRRIILIVDEIEAHLHPRWQRVIVPAMIKAVMQLESQVSPQIHLATHSPLVMASVESIFDDKTDALYKLELRRNEVMLEELPFVKRGRADYWLMSDVFGLEQARSVPAEQAIVDAKHLQETDSRDVKAIADVHGRLQASLAQDDEFWPRWLFWAEERGVK